MKANPTYPLPDAFPETEPALMTAAEFRNLRNPEGKYHEAGAYESTIESLNDNRFYFVGSVSVDARKPNLIVLGDHRWSEAAPVDELIYRDRESDKTVAVLRDGVLYRDRFYRGRHGNFPRHYNADGPRGGLVEVGPFVEKEVKDPESYAQDLIRQADQNLARYPHLLQRIVRGGERLEVRSKVPPRPDKLDTIVFLNRDKLVVARGLDEWGATLLQVAEEYRGKGLGTALAEIWYEINPQSESGGFTRAGAANARRAWESRVRLFSERGWYSALVRAGRLSAERVRKITSGLGARRATESPFVHEGSEAEKPDLRVYVDEDGVAFVLYDARFLDEPDERYIHGYGFLRDTEEHGTFFYRIEYDPAYRVLATAIGLQLARDAGEPVYVADVPGDLVEWELIPEARRKGDHVSLTQDILPLRTLAASERKARRKVDPYGQKVSELLETAESKWA